MPTNQPNITAKPSRKLFLYLLVLCVTSIGFLYEASVDQINNNQLSPSGYHYFVFSRIKQEFNTNVSTVIPLSVTAIPDDVIKRWTEVAMETQTERVHNVSLPPLKIQPDKSRRYLRIWHEDKNCSHFKIQFAKFKSFPKCGLTSFPGSGNTWLRRLLEASSGVFTGSVYEDGQLYLYGHYGEFEPWNSGTTIAQKSHEFTEDSVKRFNHKGILLLRNPYRAILAFHNFMFAGHNLYAPMSNYRRKEWPSFVHAKVKQWLEMVIHWVRDGKSVHVVHYENLRQNSTEELRRILRFLRIEIDDKRFHCVQKHMFNTFKRKAQMLPDSLDIFPNKVRDKVDRAIRFSAHLLKKYGYGNPPLELYEFYNGTTSDEITIVPCNKTESILECDERVDKMNIADGTNADRKNSGPISFLSLMNAVKGIPYNKLR